MITPFALSTLLIALIGTLAVFDTTLPAWHLDLLVSGLPFTPLTMDYRIDASDPMRSWLVIGDNRGTVHIVTFSCSSKSLSSASPFDWYSTKAKEVELPPKPKRESPSMYAWDAFPRESDDTKSRLPSSGSSVKKNLFNSCDDS